MNKNDGSKINPLVVKVFRVAVNAQYPLGVKVLRIAVIAQYYSAIGQRERLHAPTSARSPT